MKTIAALALFCAFSDMAFAQSPDDLGFGAETLGFPC
jgi:hypothetical protein